MTDSELDTFFITVTGNILKDLQDCYEYTKNKNTPEYDEINDDYLISINQLTEVLSKCTTIDDLAEMDEELIYSVFELLENYTDYYIISAEEPQKSRDLQTVSDLQELLDLFFDDEDFNEETEI